MMIFTFQHPSDTHSSYYEKVRDDEPIDDICFTLLHYAHGHCTCTAGRGTRGCSGVYPEKRRHGRTALIFSGIRRNGMQRQEHVALVEMDQCAQHYQELCGYRL